MELPQQFIQRIKALELPGGERLLQALSESEPSVSVRPNRRKPWLPAEVADEVAWLPAAHYLDRRPMFTFMPELHQGRFYVQDASSMFIAEAIRQIVAGDEPVTYLDACAAPGGKTTAAIDALPEGSLVVANEFDRKRASVLRENIVKWGSPSVVVTQGDTRKLGKLKGMFDIVAVDAPCSGEGMFRKESVAVEQWSEGLVADCRATQREILSNVWPSLAEGGYLIYSTCTFNTDENEEQLRWLVEEFGAEPVGISIDASWGILKSPLSQDIPCYRFMPGVIRGEGLFMAVVRKPGEPASGKSVRRDKPKQREPKRRQPYADVVARWLTAPEGYELSDRDGLITAFPLCHSAALRLIEGSCNVIHKGITVAQMKGRDIIPEHPLAMSLALNRGTFPEVELSADDALTYLRREVVGLPESTPRGFVVATYGGSPLGFLKNIGNRANNMYPLEWRILKKG